MKALSIRQPWAELILQGRKTIELRTWQTSHRGLLAIHASQTVSDEPCDAYNLDPAGLPRGALVGTVILADIISLDEHSWEALRGGHLSSGAFTEPIFGWRLENPQRLPQPIPMVGRMSLFHVPDEAALGEGPAIGSDVDSRAESGYNPDKPFELRVMQRDHGYGLAIYQWPLTGNGKESRPAPQRPQRLVELAGDPLRAVADHVLDALRRAGYKTTDLSRERRKPFLLDEETGLRLGLLFLVVRPLTKMNRIEAISGGLRTMPSEEAYYWFSKCTARVTAVNAQRALRILLAGE
jgi:hypothetical protein